MRLSKDISEMVFHKKTKKPRSAIFGVFLALLPRAKQVRGLPHTVSVEPLADIV